MRGYTRSEVEAFKEAAATALEEAKVELLKLTEENKALSGKYQDLKNLEETLKASVVEAQKGAEQTINNSKKEAELIITSAKQKRDDVIEEKHRKLAELETRIHELEFTRKSFYARLKSELESYLKLMNQTESDSSIKIETSREPNRNRIAKHAEHTEHAEHAEHVQHDNQTNTE